MIMHYRRWQLVFALGLVAVSAALYLTHFAIFHDAHHIAIYLLGDVAFLPLEVLIVTLIIHHLLTEREKRAMLKKLNMVIGAFFSEVGTRLMGLMAEFDPAAPDLAAEIALRGDWGDADFARVSEWVRAREPAADARRGRLTELRDFLCQRRGFLLGLLENPNLLEHEAFTELLWAVFHLTEELACRADLAHSPDTDLAHLGGDINRAYRLLVLQWLAYVRHLRDDYPYLFSLAVRTNPFNPAARPEVAS
jgi:hypothetical protein